MKSAIVGAAGLLDSGGSALLSLMTGILAVRLLHTSNLALYSLLMTGVVTCSLIPQQLYFFPSRMHANLASTRIRPSLRLDISKARYGLALAGIGILVFGTPLLAETEPVAFISLGISALLAGAMGVIQVHIRSSLHIVGHHLVAAIASLSGMLVGAGLTLYILSLPDLDPLFALCAPFGTLFAGYLVSLVSWLAVGKTYERSLKVMYAPISIRVYFAAPDLIVQVTWYLVSLIVVLQLGSTALATLEAARVAASPVFIVASGVGAVAFPRIIRFFKTGEATKALAQLKILQITIVVGGALYALVLGAFGSAASHIFQRHVDPWLSAARAGAASVEGTSNTLTTIYIVLNKPKTGVAVVLGCSLATLAFLVPLLALFGPYGVPAAQSIGTLLRTITGTRVARRTALGDAHNVGTPKAS